MLCNKNSTRNKLYTKVIHKQGFSNVQYNWPFFGSINSFYLQLDKETGGEMDHAPASAKVYLKVYNILYSLDLTTWWPSRKTSGVNVPWKP